MPLLRLCHRHASRGSKHRIVMHHRILMRGQLIWRVHSSFTEKQDELTGERTTRHPSRPLTERPGIAEEATLPPVDADVAVQRRSVAQPLAAWVAGHLLSLSDARDKRAKAGKDMVQDRRFDAQSSTCGV